MRSARQETNEFVSFQKELAEQLEEVAQNESISVNALVVQCCNYALNNMEKKSQKKK